MSPVEPYDSHCAPVCAISRPLRQHQRWATVAGHARRVSIMEPRSPPVPMRPMAGMRSE